MSGAGFDNPKHNIRRLADLPDGFGELMDIIVGGQLQEATEHVIFFGGDVQDYPENMQSHRDNGKYVRWNSVSTAGRLCERFPDAMVLVVKPHHMHLRTFSVYSQFVNSNDFGCPTHTPDFGAWQRLRNVYEEALGRVLIPACDASVTPSISNSVGSKAGATEQTCVSSGGPQTSGLPSRQNAGAWSEETVCDSAKEKTVDRSPGGAVAEPLEVPVHLIGFSKGCIVLNQLVQELEHAENDDNVQKFIGQVQVMTWLDGGHSGGSNTWVTNPVALARLATLGIHIHVHVTPYQMKDPMRKWIGKEKRRFVEVLLKAGAKVTDKLHFEDEGRSIENHFRVLEEF
ncbi:hypothetical protein ACOMHN_007075 [Nucella lapillus]